MTDDPETTDIGRPMAGDIVSHNGDPAWCIWAPGEHTIEERVLDCIWIGQFLMLRNRYFHLLLALGLSDEEIAREAAVPCSVVTASRESLGMQPNPSSRARTISVPSAAPLARLLRVLTSESPGVQKLLAVRVTSIWIIALRTEWGLHKGLRDAPSVAFSRLYDSGRTDTQIATSQGVSVDVVRRWRDRLRLPARE